MSDEDESEIREVLLAHSDDQAVRNVFGAYTDQGTADLADYVEAMRLTDGEIAVVANDGAAEVYARWNGRAGRYEHLTIWPPWTIGGYDHTDSSGVVAALEEVDDPRVLEHDQTPFANEAVLASLSHRIWP